MRLELTRRADYAIRASLALARTGDRLSVRRIATVERIPAQILPRIMTDLRRAGLVRSVAGRTGGYELAGRGGSVSLLEVIEAVEGDGRRRTCVLSSTACGLEGTCDVHQVFFEAQEAMLSALAATTLDDIVGRA